jgi:hypothetical protein
VGIGDFDETGEVLQCGTALELALGDHLLRNTGLSLKICPRISLRLGSAYEGIKESINQSIMVRGVRHLESKINHLTKRINLGVDLPVVRAQLLEGIFDLVKRILCPTAKNTLETAIRTAFARLASYGVMICSLITRKVPILC